jgi:hypothetical protein
MEAVYETVCERVDELISAYKGPLLMSTGTRAAVEELIARSEGLEKALREIALEVQELAATQERLEAHTLNNRSLSSSVR